MPSRLLQLVHERLLQRKVHIWKRVCRQLKPQNCTDELIVLGLVNCVFLVSLACIASMGGLLLWIRLLLEGLWLENFLAEFVLELCHVTFSLFPCLIKWVDFILHVRLLLSFLCEATCWKFDFVLCVPDFVLEDGDLGPLLIDFIVFVLEQVPSKVTHSRSIWHFLHSCGLSELGL